MTTLYFDPRDSRTIRRAGVYAEKAAKAAAGACEKAELTAEASAASALEGYAVEAVLFLDKSERGEVELGTKHRMAIATGLRLMYGEMTKAKEKQETDFFADTQELDERMADVARLLRSVQPGAQMDWTATSPVDAPASVREAFAGSGA